MPDNETHKTLEADVADFLDGCEFYVQSSTYHDVMPAEIRNRLSRIYTPTSLYIRGRADRLAIHRTKPIVFEWEAKTHGGSPYHNMAIEAMPFIHHLTRNRHGVDCLYCYRDIKKGYDCGFWMGDHPPIQSIKLPDRWQGEIREWYERQFNTFLPSVPVQSIGSTRGTDDPFIIISEIFVKTLPDWRHIVDRIV